MKTKFLLGFLLAFMCLLGFSSCNGCTQKAPEPTPSVQPVVTHDYDGVAQDFTAGVNHIQALHRQTMFNLIEGQEYEWRNSKVLFNDSIKLETIDELKVQAVTDVFQYFTPKTGFQVQIISTDANKGTIITPPIHDVWIEDANLSEKAIKLSAEDVLKRLKEWNGIIPPAVSMNLRLPVGPCDCNAQWVIGNEFDVIFIDAVTGDISNWNPAFNPNNKPKGGDFGKPLGEWP